MTDLLEIMEMAVFDNKKSIIHDMWYFDRSLWNEINRIEKRISHYISCWRYNHRDSQLYLKMKIWKCDSIILKSI